MQLTIEWNWCNFQQIIWKEILRLKDRPDTAYFLFLDVIAKRVSKQMASLLWWVSQTPLSLNDGNGMLRTTIYNTYCGTVLLTSKLLILFLFVSVPELAQDLPVVEEEKNMKRKKKEPKLFYQ